MIFVIRKCKPPNCVLFPVVLAMLGSLYFCVNISWSISAKSLLGFLCVCVCVVELIDLTRKTVRNWTILSFLIHKYRMSHLFRSSLISLSNNLQLLVCKSYNQYFLTAVLLGNLFVFFSPEVSWKTMERGVHSFSSWEQEGDQWGKRLTRGREAQPSF